MPKLARRWRSGALIGLAAAAVTLVILFGQFFTQPGLWLTNLLYASAPTTNRIVIVALDDASLSAYGRSVASWSRSLHADLVNVLSKDGARVVAFDVLFAEPTDADGTFAAAMNAAQDNGTGTVLAAAGAQQNTTTQAGQPLSYQSILFPVAPLHDAAAFIGHVNVNADPDDYIRRIPLAISAPDQRLVSFSVAIYLAYLHIPAEAVNRVVKFGTTTVQVTPQRIIPVDASGQMMTDFFGPAGTFPVYSYKAVHDGTVDPAVFKDKIVLVGALNAAGATDRYLVPTSRGQLMSGIEIHANAIETLLQNRPLVPQSTASRVLTILFIALVSGIVGIYLRWYWALIGYVLVLIVGFIAASVLFSVAQQVIALLYPTIALTLVLAVVLITNIRLETQSRTRTQLLLNSVSKLDEQRLILADILRQIATDTGSLLQCASVVIWLWQEETGQLEQVFAGQSITQPMTADRAALAQRSLTARHILVEAQCAVAPLIFQNVPLGAIAAIQKPTDRRFSDENLRLFQQYAERIAPALTNSRLYTTRLQQNELLEAILASSPDPMLVLDSGASLLRANLAAKALFQIEAEDYQNPVRALFEEVDLDEALLDEIDKGLSAHLDFQREVSIGTRRFNLLSAPLHVAQAGWVLVLNDITSLKELDSLKTQMIRMASHDLNNPLSVMSGYLEILMSGDMPEEQPRILVTLQQATAQMSAIIHGILDLERARAGYLNMEDTALNTLVRSVINGYETQARDKQLSLNLNIPEVPIVVRADNQQLREAINNLVGNALKYTPTSGTISVQITQTDRKVRLIITDTGYGIPKALQSNLFQPFYRAKTKATAQIPGTGLGLSLVKAVVDAHAGKVWVESEENVGSTFIIELPIS